MTASLLPPPILHSVAALYAHALKALVPAGEVLEIGLDGPYCYVDVAGLRALSPLLIEELDRALKERLKTTHALSMHEMLGSNAGQLFLSQDKPLSAAYAETITDFLVRVVRVDDSYVLAPYPNIAISEERVFFEILPAELKPWQIGEEVLDIQRCWLVAGLEKRTVKQAVKAWKGGAESCHLLRGPQQGLFRQREDGTGVQLLSRGQLMRHAMQQHFWSLHPTHSYTPVDPAPFGGLEMPDNPMCDLRHRHLKLFVEEWSGVLTQPRRYATMGTLSRSVRLQDCDGARKQAVSTEDLVTIICDADQLRSELTSSLHFIQKTLNILPLQPQFYHTTSEDWGPDWRAAEALLLSSARALGIESSAVPCDATASGPRLGYTIADARGRPVDCGFVEIDLLVSAAFGLRKKTQAGTMRGPSVLIRSLFGSVERQMVLLLERIEAPWPTVWSPEQVAILPVDAEDVDYARLVVRRLSQAGIRLCLLGPDGSIKERVAAAEARHVPWLVVLGKEEREKSCLAYRSRDRAVNKEVQIEDFIHRLLDHSENETGDFTE